MSAVERHFDDVGFAPDLVDHRRGASPTAQVLVASLKQGLSPRTSLDIGHVATLAELHGRWPPLLVHRATLMVIDGAHRLAAAKKLGMLRLDVTWFDDTLEQAVIEAIRANIEHGLPLPLPDRKRVAQDLLGAHQNWSDRFIADTCGISAKTGARLCAEVAESTTDGGTQRTTCRVGRDGRIRPASAGSRTASIVDAVRANPGASLRTIGRMTGAAPETVRRVRNRLAASLPSVDAAPDDRVPTRFADAAFSVTEQSRAFTTWFERHALHTAEVDEHVDHVPLSRVYEVIDETRRRIALWESFTQNLARRTRPSERR